MAVEPSVHPEQDAATPALPLPEGEEIGPVRPAGGSSGTNGDGRHDHHDDEDSDDVPPPTTVAGGRVPERRDDEDSEDSEGDGGDATEEAAWTSPDEVEGVRVLGKRPERTRSGDEPPVEPL
jgi:hypothetical protein